MAFRDLLTSYEEQDDGNLVQVSALELMYDEVLRMQSIDPAVFWWRT